MKKFLLLVIILISFMSCEDINVDLGGSLKVINSFELNTDSITGDTAAIVGMQSFGCSAASYSLLEDAGGSFVIDSNGEIKLNASGMSQGSYALEVYGECEFGSDTLNLNIEIGRVLLPSSKVGNYGGCSRQSGYPTASQDFDITLTQDQLNLTARGYVGGNDCSGTQWNVYTRNFNIEKISKVDDETYDLDLSFVQNTIRVIHGPYITYYNNNAECGQTNWGASTDIDLAGKNCATIQNGYWNNTNGNVVPNNGDSFFIRIKFPTATGLNLGLSSGGANEGLTEADRITNTNVVIDIEKI